MFDSILFLEMNKQYWCQDLVIQAIKLARDKMRSTRQGELETIEESEH